MNAIMKRLYLMRTIILFAGVLSTLSIAQTVGDVAKGYKTVQEAAQQGPIGMLSLAVIVMAGWVWWMDWKLTRLREKELRLQIKYTEVLGQHTDAIRALAHSLSERPCLAGELIRRPGHNTPNPEEIIRNLPGVPNNADTPV